MVFFKEVFLLLVVVGCCLFIAGAAVVVAGCGLVVATTKAVAGSVYV